MANATFVYRKGCGRELCNSPEMQAQIESLAGKTLSGASSAFWGNAWRVPAKHGGRYNVHEGPAPKNPAYVKHVGKDKKGLMRGTVVASNWQSVAVEHEYHLLKKALF